ncbi:MAG: ABC transporter permease [Acidobacteriaceae bacterium]|nr:ABC transporter permease [Acidobacteriaceae bacterium]MBV9294914.1 ABC transporter permease [Acidobacteriaceae bacterium]
MNFRDQFILLRELTATHHKLRDQSSLFGFTWSFLHPLILLAVFYLFFRYMAGSHVEHYSVYLLIGIVFYTHFSNATMAALHSLRSYRDLTADAVFPKELIVLSWILSSGIDFLVSTGICLLIAVTTGVTIKLAWFWLPILMIVQMIFTSWVGLLLSCLYVFAWDMDHLYEIALRLLFFMTPIFYIRSQLGTGIPNTIIRLNPLARIIDMARQAVLNGGGLPLGSLTAALILNLLALSFAYQIFKRLEPRFAENV